MARPPDNEFTDPKLSESGVALSCSNIVDIFYTSILLCHHSSLILCLFNNFFLGMFRAEHASFEHFWIKGLLRKLNVSPAEKS